MFLPKSQVGVDEKAKKVKKKKNRLKRYGVDQTTKKPYCWCQQQGLHCDLNTYH